MLLAHQLRLGDFDVELSCPRTHVDFWKEVAKLVLIWTKMSCLFRKNCEEHIFSNTGIEMIDSTQKYDNLKYVGF